MEEGVLPPTDYQCLDDCVLVTENNLIACCPPGVAVARDVGVDGSAADASGDVILTPTDSALGALDGSGE